MLEHCKVEEYYWNIAKWRNIIGTSQRLVKKINSLIIDGMVPSKISAKEEIIKICGAQRLILGSRTSETDAGDRPTWNILKKLKNKRKAAISLSTQETNIII